MASFFMTINSPIGLLNLCSDGQSLLSISFNGDALEQIVEFPEILIQAKQQLEEYFSGVRQSFDLLLNPQGTDFQRRVWDQLALARYGTTLSYVEIARKLGSENFSRAVGMANGKNPLPIIIPCHRIIGNNGKLTGYVGGLDRKKWLLLHELGHSEIKGEIKFDNAL
jgi:methylated-DNA-[protein]-cysteine S-methyltransferase